MEKISIELDKTSTIPLADQIYNGILRQIINGELNPGQKLATERELADSFGIARGTVKRAYLKLCNANAIEIRKGSGSYVLKNDQIVEENQKQEAMEIISDAFLRIRSLGLSDKEIINLISLQTTARESVHKANIMVVSNNYEILSELEKQLSYLSGASRTSFTLSFLTLDVIRGNSDPLHMLHSYDIIIATSIDYPAIAELAPMYIHKMVEATITPHTSTLIELSEISKNQKIRIIYRTQVFLSLVHRTLLSLGFASSNILATQELEYDPLSHSDDGVGVVVNFNESPVYINPAFEKRNSEFVEHGGKLVHFVYRIDRASLTYIEDRIQSFLSSEEWAGLL